MTQSILIIEDRDEHMTVLAALLEPSGVKLFRAAHVNDALLLLAKQEVALILLDAHMNGSTSTEIAELIRRNKKNLAIPLIFIGEPGDRPFTFRGFDAGAVDFMARPLDKALLLGKVKALLNLDRQRRELEFQLEEIRRQQQLNWQLLQSLGDGLVAVDQHGVISFANPAMSQLFGLDPKAITERGINEVLCQSVDGANLPWSLSDIFKASSKGERLCADSGYFIRSQRDMVPVSLSAAPVYNGDNIYSGAVFTLRVIGGVRPEKAEPVDEQTRKGRRQVRKKMSTVLRMFERGTGTNLGRLADISVDGFKLVSRTALAEGRKYNISTILPEQIAGSNTLSFESEVVWCRPQPDNPQEYGAGFRIIRITENDQNVLNQLIERY